MRLFTRIIWISFILKLFFFSGSFAQFQEREIKKIEPVSFSATIFTKENKEKFLALTYNNDKKWHTYWKNPGSAGIPLSFEFFSGGKKINLPSEEWPSPKRYYEEGNLLAYGYEGQYTFFFPLSSKKQQALEGKNLEIKSKWLVCKDICIPGQGFYNGSFTQGRLEPLGLKKVLPPEEDLKKAFYGLPQKSPFPDGLKLEIYKKKGAQEFYLSYQLNNKKERKLPEVRNILTPFPQLPFDFHREIAVKENQVVKAQMRVEWDGEFLDPPLPFPHNSTFKKPFLLKFLYTDLEGRVRIIEKSFKGFLNAIKTTPTTKKVISQIEEKPLPLLTQRKKPLEKAPTSNQNIPTTPKRGPLLYFIFAIFGGFILNFMPCVFPVISLKIFSLLKQKSMDQAAILKHNIVYTSGILFSFFVLSLVVLLFKMSGEHIGWGFHLQSAPFVAIMVIFLFILSLNLFGLYDIRTPGGKLIGNIDVDQSYKGDFISGLLATVLSTPCSAPFLGVALTFAFTSPFPYTLLIFLSVGLGLALPFLLIGFFPSLLNILPKPGAWMDHFKKFLGLSLLLTGLWLFDVYRSLTSHVFSSTLLTLTLILIFFFFYALKKMNVKKLQKSFLLALPLSSFLYLIFFQLNEAPIGPSTNVVTTKEKLNPLWEKWSPEKMEEYQKLGQLVFVDFTAKWCFTCIVNEKLVLHTKEFEKLIKEKRVKALHADWTKRDPIIGGWLKKQGIFGLPAYFIQTHKGDLISLGETISIKEIRENLTK